MLLRASHLVTMDGAPIPNGTIRIEGNTIQAVLRENDIPNGEPVTDLRECVLAPGLINAHCHLDYTAMKGALFPGKSFTSWIKDINALKSSLSADDFQTAIENGIELLLDSGCTTVFNIEAFPELLIRLERPPLRIWWFLELIDVRSRMHSLEDVLGAFSFFEDRGDWLGGFGLSPHAPYTASIELYRLARHCAEELGMPVTTHIAESSEEQSMFLHGEGPLHAFLTNLGRDMSDCGHGSALSHLYEFGLVPANMIIVHANYLQDHDWEWIRQQPPAIAHCPKCHAYFGHRRFELEALSEAGCPILIGTDSLASNNSLDLRSELRELRKTYPHLNARQCLEMVTTAPALAIGQAGKLGVIRPGALADLVAFPTISDDPHESILQSRDRPACLIVDGQIIRDRNLKRG